MLSCEFSEINWNVSKGDRHLRLFLLTDYLLVTKTEKCHLFHVCRLDRVAIGPDGRNDSAEFLLFFFFFFNFLIFLNFFLGTFKLTDATGGFEMQFLLEAKTTEEKVMMMEKIELHVSLYCNPPETEPQAAPKKKLSQPSLVIPTTPHKLRVEADQDDADSPGRHTPTTPKFGGNSPKLVRALLPGLQDKIIPGSPKHAEKTIITPSPSAEKLALPSKQPPPIPRKQTTSHPGTPSGSAENLLQAELLQAELLRRVETPPSSSSSGDLATPRSNKPPIAARPHSMSFGPSTPVEQPKPVIQPKPASMRPKSASDIRRMNSLYGTEVQDDAPTNVAPTLIAQPDAKKNSILTMFNRK